MYELMIEDYFSAAHSLKGYKGNCERLHGHNWRVQIFVKVKKLDNIYLGIDFRILKKILKETLELLDHKYLNEIEFFKKYNTSTEKIAEFIYIQVDKKLKLYKNVKLEKVICWESANSYAAYFK